jgi:peroxiredoxin
MASTNRQEHDVAIDFTVMDSAGRPWTLSDHLDAGVVLTFQRGDF